MLVRVVLFADGVLAWSFVEYAIHGWLGHRFRTFATPLHAVHHQDPHAVFTVGAWIPVTTVTLAAVAIFGNSTGVYGFYGLVAGFVLYEVIHYRIHFAHPSNRFEERLRGRHLAHHLRVPDAIFGVTNALWDHAFGTEPAADELRRIELAAATLPPLTGESNWRRAFTLAARRA
jgi:dihydroceramide fatty acyl 2-hydroxylase